MKALDYAIAEQSPVVKILALNELAGVPPQYLFPDEAASLTQEPKHWNGTSDEPVVTVFPISV